MNIRERLTGGQSCKIKKGFEGFKGQITKFYISAEFFQIVLRKFQIIFEEKKHERNFILPITLHMRSLPSQRLKCSSGLIGIAPRTYSWKQHCPMDA